MCNARQFVTVGARFVVLDWSTQSLSTQPHNQQDINYDCTIGAMDANNEFADPRTCKRIWRYHSD